ncbi:hypothetical protein CDAR_374511 [Caerostris darwini]|uniref:Uncharacterized protein n=1 Tax=Caerostris darwini TaxID=1538125 RepID=A0AAV4NG68_9ARAC|nr:hypothetical protein CDAR_374511 [Caerostris darwini]
MEDPKNMASSLCSDKSPNNESGELDDSQEGLFATKLLEDRTETKLQLIHYPKGFDSEKERHRVEAFR